MLRKKYSVTALILLTIVVIASSNIIPSKGRFTNLKVLPQDISENRLDSIMDSYNRALKVSCDFCHSKAGSFAGLPPAGDAPLDFALDNGMKETARRMMRLTIDINKTYFSHVDSSIAGRPDYLLNVISCNTCHRGNPYPAHE